MYDAAQLQDAVAYQAPPSLRQSEESGDNIYFCIHPPEQSRLFQTEIALCPFLRGMVSTNNLVLSTFNSQNWGQLFIWWDQLSRGGKQGCWLDSEMSCCCCCCCTCPICCSSTYQSSSSLSLRLWCFLFRKLILGWKKKTGYEASL